MNIIETRDLTHVYRGKIKALNNVNFAAKPGERIAIIGANGAGKSTLFKHFNGILRPTTGEVLIKGEPVTDRNILKVRKTVGVVFQDPDDQIFAPTVKQDVAFGPVNLGLPQEVVEKRVIEALETVRLTGFEERAPHHLSAGEKKKVAIAGILAMQPEVLVLDEPTAGLDPGGAMRLIWLINEMNRYLGITIITATHEVDIVPLLADRVCIMSSGRIIGDGSPQKIFATDELIRKTHLRLPLVAQLLEMLQDEGVPVDVKFTLEEARDELLRVVKQNASDTG
ncbi:MAG TPA: ATP-binding cassette domain-containing protein [Candidatus Methanoperedens sp.]|nr:ATP-binding cassette domain-containing protein [Candidatus Methanoperedens sp.]HLB70373.1 ATP-binding cassette domain-containing protein [Candidatus Methanoperedens sp.]